MALDPKKLAIAKQVALGRWGKPFNHPIKTKLDEPKEWVDEANHLNNDLMPPLLAAKEPTLQWIFVLPVEFGNPQVTTVGSYALFIYAHLKYRSELTDTLRALHDEHLGEIEESDPGDPTDAIETYLDLYAWGTKQ